MYPGFLLPVYFTDLLDIFDAKEIENTDGGNFIL